MLDYCEECSIPLPRSVSDLRGELNRLDDELDLSADQAQVVDANGPMGLKYMSIQHGLISSIIGHYSLLIREESNTVDDLKDLGWDMSVMDERLTDALTRLNGLSRLSAESLVEVQTIQGILDSIKEEANTKEKEYKTMVEDLHSIEKAIEDGADQDHPGLKTSYEEANTALLDSDFENARGLIDQAMQRLRGETPTTDDQQVDNMDTADEINEKRELVSSHLDLLSRHSIGHEEIAHKFDDVRKRMVDMDLATIDQATKDSLLTGLNEVESEVEKLVITEANEVISSTVVTIKKAPSYIGLKDEAVLVNDASSAMANGEFYIALENSCKARDAVEKKKEEYKSILKSIQVCEVKVKEFRKENVVDSSVDDTLVKAKDALKGGDFDTAIQYVNDTYQKLEELKNPLVDSYRTKAQVAIEDAKATLADLQKQGCDTVDYESILDQATNYFDDGDEKEDFIKVIEYTEAAKAEAGRCLRRLRTKVEEGKKLGTLYAEVKEKYDTASEWLFMPDIKRMMDEISDLMVQNETDKVEAALKNVEEKLNEAIAKTNPELSGELFMEGDNAAVRLVNFGSASADNVVVDINGVGLQKMDTIQRIGVGESVMVNAPLDPAGPAMADGTEVKLNIICTKGDGASQLMFSESGTLTPDLSGNLTTSSLVLANVTPTVTHTDEEREQRVSYEGKVEFTDSYPDDKCPVCDELVPEEAMKVTCVCKQQFHIACIGKIKFCPDCGLSMQQ